MAGSKPYSRREFFERTVARFWENVDRKGPDDCWLWTGQTLRPNPCGMIYGSFSFYDGKTINYRAHRFSWMLHNGRIPDGLLVMHSCDVPLCVNPNHLSVGTTRDNEDDKVAKGRSRKGTQVVGHKLNDEKVMLIRQSPESDTALAERFGVHPTTIRNARIGKKWGHLPFPESTGDTE